MGKPIEGKSVDIMMLNINLVRRDIGNLLFHFTKETTSPRTGAPAVLRHIVTEKRLLGFPGPAKDDSNCICFTEAPITELAAVFLLPKIASKSQHPPYKPYGIAVKKKWLYDKGGRPVIYQKEAEYEYLPKELRYRHVTYEPLHLKHDSSWEREWRIQVDELMLDPAETLVIVRSADDAMHFEQTLDPVERIDGKPVPIDWMVVPLDLFGLPESDR